MAAGEVNKTPIKGSNEQIEALLFSKIVKITEDPHDRKVLEDSIKDRYGFEVSLADPEKQKMVLGRMNGVIGEIRESAQKAAQNAGRELQAGDMTNAALQHKAIKLITERAGDNVDPNKFTLTEKDLKEVGIGVTDPAEIDAAKKKVEELNKSRKESVNGQSPFEQLATMLGSIFPALAEIFSKIAKALTGQDGNNEKDKGHESPFGGIIETFKGISGGTDADTSTKAPGNASVDGTPAKQPIKR